MSLRGRPGSEKGVLEVTQDVQREYKRSSRMCSGSARGRPGIAKGVPEVVLEAQREAKISSWKYKGDADSHGEKKERRDFSEWNATLDCHPCLSLSTPL